MTGAFIFLLSRSFLNRTKARLKRLRQPKYLVGAIFGLIYLYGYFFRFLFMRGRAGPNMLGEANSILGDLGAVILLVIVAAAWIFPYERAALVFSEAEIAFLFPAPVTRRTLIHYKLLKSQTAILFTVLLLTLITGRVFIGSHAWMRIVGWWIILSTLNLHFLGASLTRTMLLDRGISNWWRRTIVLLLVAALLAGTIFWTRQTIAVPSFDNAVDWKAWRDYVQSLLGTAPLSYLITPFRVVLGPYLATSLPAFAKSLGLAASVIVLHYIWVVRMNVAFEEASLNASRRFAERLSAARQGRALEGIPAKGRRAPFKLVPAGFPPVAFLWKNLIHAQGTFRGRTLILLAIPLLVMATVMMGNAQKGSAFVGIVSMITLMIFVWSLLIGTQFVRCDFRQDLAVMDVLKMYPLRGWQVVAGQILAPLVILSTIQWLLLLLFAIVTGVGGAAISLPRPSLEWIFAAAMMVPFWNGLALLIPNAAVLLFPGWFQSRADAPQGIEVTGQRLLLLFGQLLIIGVTILPAALAFAVGFLPLKFAALTSLAPLTGALAAAAALAGEIALGVWLVGKLFDRFDLAME